MQKGLLYSTVLSQEQRAIRLFLLLFYGIGFSFDAFYYYIYPYYMSQSREGGPPPGSFGCWMYVLQIALLPAALYVYRKRQVVAVKYLYLFTFLATTLAHDLYVFSSLNQVHFTARVVEVLFMLCCPIFLSKRFFWIVVGGIAFKYAVLFSTTWNPSFVMPTAQYLILGVMSYIMLHQYIRYVSAVRDSFDRQMEGIVKGIIATLELKDPYTRGHSERVAYFSLELAKRLNRLSEKEMKSYYYACLLHDVGKVSVPDHILTKPASLTEKEFEIIQTHPVVGLNVIKHIDGLQNSLSVVLHHHERWDGKGYPHKLNGEQIPLLARITAVADAFDAMTTKRSYREALTVEEAYERIVNGAGTQFDPAVVELFREVFPHFAQYVKAEHAKMSYQKPLRLEVGGKY